ncbi:MAG TPA: hypothetical protein VF690_10085 [Hymenobacter sp.]|jgi:hypothetical protein
MARFRDDVVVRNGGYVVCLGTIAFLNACKTIADCNRLLSMRDFCFKRTIGWVGLLVTMAVSSCISTRYQGMNTCPVTLGPTDKVLVLYLRPIPLARSATYFQALKKQFDEHRVPVRYAPEEEWELRAAGVNNPLDSTQYPALRRQGYTYCCSSSAWRSKKPLACGTPILPGK